MILPSIILAAAAQASAQTATPASTATAPKPAGEKIVCRMQQESAHTRIASRICRTEAEWEQIAKDAQDDMRRSTNQRHVPGNSSSN